MSPALRRYVVLGIIIFLVLVAVILLISSVGIHGGQPSITFDGKTLSP